ncbi:hypothetical protein HN51_022745, partial [Arachis hypogaea]
VSELESLEASIGAAFEAIISRGTNSHVVPSHYVGGESGRRSYSSAKLPFNFKCLLDE